MTSLSWTAVVAALGTALVVAPAAAELPFAAQFAALAAGAPADSSGAAAPVPERLGAWLPAREEGAWLRADRLQHASLSATLVLGGGAAGAGRTPAALGALALGILKEGLDARRGAGASRRDLVADVAGVALGWALWGALR